MILQILAVSAKIERIHEDWPYRTHEPVDVWLYWVPPHHDPEEWRYLPGLVTIADALASVNLSVAYADASQPNPQFNGILVLFGFWNFQVEGTVERVQRAVDDGVYLILYNSEPLGYGIGKRTTQFLYNASEIWDYSLWNLEWLRSRGVTQKLRHVPPGYVRAFDLGVTSTGHGLGAVGTRPPHRSYVIPNATRRTVQSWGDMHQFLTEFPLQLVFHRVANGHQCPFEAFRGAILAANHACIISQDSHPLDQHYWANVVHFAPTSSDLVRFVDHFARPDMLQDCQRKTYAHFLKHHSASAILHRAGVFDLLFNQLGWPRRRSRHV